MQARSVTRRGVRNNAAKTALSAAILLSAMMLPSDVKAQAGAVFYECDLTHNEESKFWVSAKMGIVVLKDASIRISDGASLAYGVSPLPVQVVRNTEQEMRLSWQLEGGLRQQDGRPILVPSAEYTARLIKATNRLTVRGKLQGIRRSFSGKGTCVIKQTR